MNSLKSSGKNDLNSSQLASMVTRVRSHQFSLYIFHDAEKCCCPEICNGSSSALKIRDEVLTNISNALKRNSRFTSEIDPIIERIQWNFVLSFPNLNHPTPTLTFINNLSTNLGVLEIKVNVDIVDDPRNKIKSLLKEYVRHRELRRSSYTEDQRERNIDIVVLISDDRDFLDQINLLRNHKKLTVILLNSPNDCSSDAAYLQNSVGESSSLGVWDSIIVSARPPPSLARTLGTCGQSLAPELEINEMKLYLSYPKIKDEVEAIGFKNLCDSSQGTLSYSVRPGGQITRIHVSKVNALKVFIRNRGGRIKAKEYGSFHQYWTNLGETMKNWFKKNLGNLKELCDYVDGLPYEVSSKDTGYGYVSCVDDPPANYDLIMKVVRFVISEEEANAPPAPPEKYTIIVVFPKTFHYVRKYLQREIEVELANICNNVGYEWNMGEEKITVCYLPEFINEHTTTTYANDLKDCKIYLEKVKCQLVVEEKITNIAWSDRDLKYDIELKNLLRDKLVHMQIVLRVAPDSSPKPVSSLIMYFPEHWGSNEESLRQRIRTKVQSILQLNQRAKVVVGRIVLIYQPHALITVESDIQKYILLDGKNCSNDEVKFERLSDDLVDVVLTCPESYYNRESEDGGEIKSTTLSSCISPHRNLDRCEDCGWSHVVLNQIKDLERVGPKRFSDDELAMRVFPNLSDAYRQKTLKDFLGYDVAYKILLNNMVNEVAQVIKSNYLGNNEIFLANMISVRKDLDGVEFLGLKKYLALAENFLVNYIKSALVKVVYVNEENRINEDMFSAIRSRCSAIASDADASVGESHSINTLNARVPCKIFIDYPNKEFVGIIALPECRALWNKMVEEVEGLVNSFAVKRFPMKKSMSIPSDEIKNIFGLVNCSVEKQDLENLVVVVSGKKNSVDDAIEYIEQMPTRFTYDKVEVTCPGELGGADAAHYLRLPGVRPTILALCTRVTDNYPGFSATVSDTAKGDNDSSVLTLQGPPDSVSTVVNFALADIRKILRDTKLYTLTLPEHEVQWLIRNKKHTGAGIDVWIRFGRSESMECPSDVVNDSSIPCLNKVHNIGSLRVFVAERGFKNLSSFECDATINSANCNFGYLVGLDRDLIDGEVFTTAAFNSTSSKLKHIVHVVAPSIQDLSPTFDQRAIFRDCICKALHEAAKVESTCFAIPGAGIFNWPVTDSANEIVQAIHNWVLMGEDVKQDCLLKKVVLFDSNVNMVAAFSSALELLENDSGPTSSNSLALPPGPPPIACNHTYAYEGQNALDKEGDAIGLLQASLSGIRNGNDFKKNSQSIVENPNTPWWSEGPSVPLNETTYHDRKMPAVIDLSNVFIFGKKSDFEAATISIDAAISKGRRSQIHTLNGVKTSSGKCLHEAVQDLSEKLRAVNAEITVVNCTLCRVLIGAMGKSDLDEAIRLVKLYDNEISEHHQIPQPPKFVARRIASHRGGW